MQELLKLIDKFEEKSGRTCVEIRIFSDGSGTVNEYGVELFSFDTLDYLIQWLEA
jgi:hypothetical protein